MSIDSPSTSSRLQIAVLGLRGIGSTFAFQLSRTGQHDVTAIARTGSPRLAQLQRDGGIVNAMGEYPQGKARLHAMPDWIVAAMLWSVSRIPSFRELLATGINECRALVDVLVANAPGATPPVLVGRIQAMKPSEVRK